MCSWARSRNLNDASKFRHDRKIAATRVGLTAREQTSMLVCRGEVREFGLTGLTRNQVSLTAPGVRIPPSPPPSLRLQRFCYGIRRKSPYIDSILISHGTRDRLLPARFSGFPRFISVSNFAGAA